MTPQAKGRIERVWGTFQDRLVSELRLAGATTIDQANNVLWDFLPRFNRQFGVPAAEPGSAYRQPPDGLCLDAVLCFKYIRTVANDNTVRFNGHTLQLMSNEHRASYARATVEVQERLDGTIVVVHQGRTLATEPAPHGPVEIRARSGRRPNGHPLPDGSDRSFNGALSHPVDDERRNGSQDPTGCETPQWRPAPDHPWRRRLLT